MFIQWQTGVEPVNLGTVQVKHCPNCGQERPFHAILRYHYRAVYWIFSSVTDREWHVACSTCQQGERVETHEVGSLGWNPPIPFMRAHGMKVLLFLLVGLLTVAGVGAAFSSHPDADAPAREAITTLRELVGVCRSAHNPEDLAAVHPRIEDLNARLQQRLRQLRALPQEQLARLETKYGRELEDLLVQLQQENQRLEQFVPGS
jgi:hypothetical protein